MAHPVFNMLPRRITDAENAQLEGARQQVLAEMVSAIDPYSTTLNYVEDRIDRIEALTVIDAVLRARGQQ